MHTSERGISLIKEFEGGRSPDGLFHPYRDAVGVPTIGYGHTEGVSLGMRPLTQAQADDLLRKDLAKKYEGYVNPFAASLNQNQFDALVSFVFNLGGGMLQSSHTIGAALRRKDLTGVSSSFGLYVYAGGTRLAGLVRRRAAERALFDAPAARTPTRDERKVAKWKAELDEIRAYIKAHGGHWKNHPVRWARARALKRVLAKRGVKV